MSRTVWFVAGAGAGVIVVRRLQRLAEALTVDGLRDRVDGLGAAARVFRDEATAGRAEKETELRERLGLLPPGTTPPQIAGARPGSTGSGATHELHLTEQKGTS